MWSTHALFGHGDFADHPTPAGDSGNSAHLLGDHTGHTLWGESIPLCHVCHAELLPHEFGEGCCDDKDACCWRALSGRCCW
jgi:hypothetical protein